MLRPGDQLELRGPIDGYFTWEVTDGVPLLLVAGGSGIASLMAMLRHRARVGSRIPCRLLYSSRSGADIIYRMELDTHVREDDALQVIHTLTRVQPPGWDGYRRRIDTAMLAEVAWSPEARPGYYVCQSSGLVESVSSTLVELRHDPMRIRTERFRPTGG